MKRIRTFSIIGLSIIIAATFLVSCRKKEKPAAEPPSSSTPSVELPDIPSAPPESQPSAPERSDPTESVIGLLEAVRIWDMQKAGQYLSGEASFDRDIPAALLDPLKKIAGQMHYEILDASAREDTAEVTLDITTPSLEKSMNDVIAALVKYAAKQKLLGRELGGTDEILGIMASAVTIESLPEKTFRVTVHLIADENEAWKVDMNDPENMPLLNAVTGGLPDFIEQMQEKAESYGVSIW